MKKIALIFIIGLAFVSCNKDEEDTPEVNLLLGEWNQEVSEVLEGDSIDRVEYQHGSQPKLIITEDKYTTEDDWFTKTYNYVREQDSIHLLSDSTSTIIASYLIRENTSNELELVQTLKRNPDDVILIRYFTK